jgi:hypothetical protein
MGLIKGLFNFVVITGVFVGGAYSGWQAKSFADSAMNAVKPALNVIDQVSSLKESITFWENNDNE